MHYRHIVGFLLITVLVSACGTIATPASEYPTRTPIPPRPTSTPLPTPTPPTPVDPSVAQAGRWVWKSFQTSAAAYPPVQLWIDVADAGAVKGRLSVYPDYSEIPEAARTLIQQNGCNLDFDSLEGDALSGLFFSSTDALVRANVSECNVKFYGPVTLKEPLQGEFLLAYDEVITQALIAEATRPLTPIERGRNVFTVYCSACHGSFGEGMPAVPSLMTDQVRNYTDEQLRTIVSNGVVGTIMPAWGVVLKPEDLDGVLELVRNIEILETGG